MSVEIIDNSPLFLEALHQRIPTALEAVGQKAEGYAKGYAPHDTGRLEGSISHATDDDTAYIGTNVDYAIYQEFGTRKMSAHPYLTPAVTNHLGEYQNIVESILKG